MPKILYVCIMYIKYLHLQFYIWHNYSIYIQYTHTVYVFVISVLVNGTTWTHQLPALKKMCFEVRKISIFYT